MKNINFSNKRKFFYDCEFMEKPGFLQLISIGVISEEGREFYACNSDADLRKANSWVKGNVIPILPDKSSNNIWKKEDTIRNEIFSFLNPSEDDPVELWGYYCDYDHVLMSWLFGRMVDLPKGMPMYTLDVRQLIYHMENISVPDQKSGQHNALEDARWVKETYDYLRKVEQWDL